MKASELSPTPSPSESIVSFASLSKASALSPTPSPSESIVSLESNLNASFWSNVPSPSLSISMITAESWLVTVSPNSVPSFGVTVTVHVSPMDVADEGIISKSLKEVSRLPSIYHLICELVSASFSWSENMYESVIDLFTSTLPFGVNIRLEATGATLFGNGSSSSNKPSPSLSISMITAESWQFTVTPSSVPSCGVTVTVHVSSTDVADEGIVSISLNDDLGTPSAYHLIWEPASGLLSWSEYVYESVIDLFTSTFPFGVNIRLEATGATLLGNGSSPSEIPSPSLSMSIISALSGLFAVAPNSVPSCGVTLAVHDSPTIVAEEGIVSTSLNEDLFTPSTYHSI